MDAQELRQTVASNIKRYRKLCGLTQMALAERADISVGYMCALEAGSKWGAPETIAKLAASLHIDPYQLFLSRTSPDLRPLASVLFSLRERLKGDIDARICEFLRDESA